MNYDSQQYAFTNGPAASSQLCISAAPQVHMSAASQVGMSAAPQVYTQKDQLHPNLHQQQQTTKKHHNEAAQTSNTYHPQFSQGSRSADTVLQQKDARSVGIPGSIQPGTSQLSMFPQTFIKQGLAHGLNSNMTGSLDGAAHLQYKNYVKMKGNIDCRMKKELERVVRVQQDLVEQDNAASGLVEKSLDQQQGTVGCSMSTYGNHISRSPHQTGVSERAQEASGRQSALPSFGHVWPRLPHQKQSAFHHEEESHQNLNAQFQNQLHHHQQQQHKQSKLQFTNPSFSTLPGIQTIRTKKTKKEKIQHSSSWTPASSHVSQKLNCYPTLQQNILPPECPGMDIVIPEESVTSPQPPYATSSTQPASSCTNPHHPSTAVTYTTSGPPKVTVTLDSLSHKETLSPNQLPVGSGTSSLSPTRTMTKSAKTSNSKNPIDLETSALSENSPQYEQDWQKRPKHLSYAASSLSSLERPSSESSNFSSPSLTMTPPSSLEVMLSQVPCHIPKQWTEQLLSSTSPDLSQTPDHIPKPWTECILPSSSPVWSLSLSPPSLTSSESATQCANSATFSSVNSTSLWTASSSSIGFSCSTTAITTTSITSTTCSSGESTCVASAHIGLPLISVNSLESPAYSMSCSSAHKLLYSPAVISSLSQAHKLLNSPANQTLIPDVVTEKRRINVPYNWHRECKNGTVVYLSPSGAILQSFEQICHYLLSDDTCKCGLECPIQVEKYFSFDPEVESQPWNTSSDNLRNLCNRRREILALAAFHSSCLEADANFPGQVLEPVKKERRKSASSAEMLIVSPPKKLKTAITNVINKHTESADHRKPSVSSAANESYVALDADFSQTSASFNAGGGSSSSRWDLLGQDIPKTSRAQMGRVELHEEQPGSGGKRKEGRCEQMQGVSKKQELILLRQVHEHASTQFGEVRPKTYMPLFPQGCGPESIHDVQSSCSASTSPQSHTQHQQPLHHHHHHDEHQANPELFLPQSHMHLSEKLLTSQQPPQRPNPTMWHDSISEPLSHAAYHHISRPHPQGFNFHTTNFINPQIGDFTKHTNRSKQEFLNQSLVDSKKSKSKRGKGKRDKQINIFDSEFPFSDALAKRTKTIDMLSTSDSFFGNPLDFVEQQAAIINSSIASCQLVCPSPSPPKLDSSKYLGTFPLKKEALFENNFTARFSKDVQGFRKSSVEDFVTNGSSDKDEEEDQKTGTDLDSNKSFSDTTENNDSAYLSQTGSDQEKSDTVDGLDSCFEAKSSSVCYLNSLEQNERTQNVDLSDRSFELNMRVECLMSQNRLGPVQRFGARADIGGAISAKSQGNKKPAKPKSRQKAGSSKKDVHIDDVDLLKEDLQGSLSGDLDDLLASEKWNMPIFQQVLAQLSGAGLVDKEDSKDIGGWTTSRDGQDTAWMSAGTQQVQRGREEFPASNLLSAAARAQHTLGQNELSFKLAHNEPGLSTHLNLGQIKQSSPSHPNTVKTEIPQSKTAKIDAVPSMSIAMGTNVTTSVSQAAQSASSGATVLVNGVESRQLVRGSDPPVSIAVGTTNMTASLSQAALPVSAGGTVLVNGVDPKVRMNGAVPPVSLTVGTTNMTISLSQAAPAISVNQPALSSKQITRQLWQNCGQQLLNTGLPTQPTSTLGQVWQLATIAPQEGSHLVNATIHPTHLLKSSAAQITDSLSLQGNSNHPQIASLQGTSTQLPIASLQYTNSHSPVAGPVQQKSPSGNLLPFCPASTAQTHSQPQQVLISSLQIQNQNVLPSSLQSQTQNQNSLIDISPQASVNLNSDPIVNTRPQIRIQHQNPLISISPQALIDSSSDSTHSATSQIVIQKQNPLINSSPQAPVESNSDLIAKTTTQINIQQQNPLTNSSPQTSSIHLIGKTKSQIHIHKMTPLANISPQTSTDLYSDSVVNTTSEISIQKQNSLTNISHCASTELNLDSIINSTSHINIGKSPQAEAIPNKVNLTNSASQIKDPIPSLAYTSTHMPADKSVLMLPQPNTSLVMQILGSSQPLGSSASSHSVVQSTMAQLPGQPARFDPFQILLSVELEPILTAPQQVNAVKLSAVQQGETQNPYAAHKDAGIASINDTQQRQIQNPLAAQTVTDTANISNTQQQQIQNPLIAPKEADTANLRDAQQLKIMNLLATQQITNKASLSEVQKQQLEILQLQKLMLGHIQKAQDLNPGGVLLPASKISVNTPVTATGAQIKMNTSPTLQANLQPGCMTDVSKLLPSMYPAAQGSWNQQSPLSAQLLQHSPSTPAARQITPTKPASAVHTLLQAPVNHLHATHSLQPQHPTCSVPAACSKPSPSATSTQEHSPPPTLQTHQKAKANPKFPPTPAKPATTNKPKSKSKKSESRRAIDHEAEKDEEKIVATVQQILAQAVQQQKELNLAAKNQPPLATKSKSKKSRSKSNQACKEPDLGKLASISDDIITSRREGKKLDKFVSEVSSNFTCLTSLCHFESQQSLAGSSKCSSFSSDTEMKQSSLNGQNLSSKCSSFSVSTGMKPADSSNSLNDQNVSSKCSSLPAATWTKEASVSNSLNGFNLSNSWVTCSVEPALNKTNFRNSTTRKSSLSLRDHLSSIISKDRGCSNKKVANVASSIQENGQCLHVDNMGKHTAQTTPGASGDSSSLSQLQRTSII